MPKLHPKLETNYENTDPDYTPGTASSSGNSIRNQPARNAKKSFLENVSEFFTKSADPESVNEQSVIPNY